jgi:bile acid-coenzyme A ligase
MAPPLEVQAIVELADSRVIVGAEPGTHGARVCLPAGWEPPTDDTTPLPDVVPNPWKAMTSGGSTGRPKLILAADGGRIDSDMRPLLMLDPAGCLMMPGPLYHNGPFMWTATALLAGAAVVLGGRFDAETTLALIEQHRADVLYVVPTMMQRIWRLPEAVRDRYDVSSLRVVWHLAAPCPAWLKEAWIGWLGPEKIVELYAGTEAQASTVIVGTEWLEHRGSVGRPLSGQMKIVGPDGEDLPPGEVGEIFMRANDPSKATYQYVGAEARTLGDGWESLGDMGSFDADGYLYLADRKTDMILVGGSNVYPAEVEAALEEHPAVQSAVVIGLPDDDLGSRPHAIVHATAPVVDDDLRTFLGERLVRYKIPRTFEYVDEPLRDDAGKVRRSALKDARG